jgi:hypothetical protein
MRRYSGRDIDDRSIGGFIHISLNSGNEASISILTCTIYPASDDCPTYTAE